MIEFNEELQKEDSTNAELVEFGGVVEAWIKSKVGDL